MTEENQGAPGKPDRAAGLRPQPPAASSRSSIPSAGPVRRTISPFASVPRDGSVFHTMNSMRFNPIMERFEVLVYHTEDGDRLVWQPANFGGHEPTMWLRRVPLPYEIPDTAWFPVDFTVTYIVRRKSRWSRFLAWLFRDVQTFAWRWRAAAQGTSPGTAKTAQRAEGRSPAGPVAAGDAPDPSPDSPHHGNIEGSEQ